MNEQERLEEIIDRMEFWKEFGFYHGIKVIASEAMKGYGEYSIEDYNQEDIIEIESEGQKIIIKLDFDNLAQEGNVIRIGWSTESDSGECFFDMTHETIHDLFYCDMLMEVKGDLIIHNESSGTIRKFKRNQRIFLKHTDLKGFEFDNSEYLAKKYQEAIHIIENMYLVEQPVEKVDFQPEVFDIYGDRFYLD